MQTLVWGVSVALGVFDAEQEGGSAAKELGEGADEADGTASTNGQGLLFETSFQGPAGGIEGGSGRIGHPPITGVAAGVYLHFDAPGWVGAKEVAHGLDDILGLHVGDGADAEDGTGLGQHLIGSLGDGTGFHGNDSGGG